MPQPQPLSAISFHWLPKNAINTVFLIVDNEQCKRKWIYDEAKCFFLFCFVLFFLLIVLSMQINCLILQFDSSSLHFALCFIIHNNNEFVWKLSEANSFFCCLFLNKFVSITAQSGDERQICVPGVNYMHMAHYLILLISSFILFLIPWAFDCDQYVVRFR